MQIIEMILQNITVNRILICVVFDLTLTSCIVREKCQIFRVIPVTMKAVASVV